MTEQPLDIRAILKPIWRRRVLVAAIAVAGLVGAIGYGMAHPQRPRAVTLVLLPAFPLTSSGQPAVDVRTEMVVATSNPVLTTAGNTVNPLVTAGELKGEVSVTALTSQVMEIAVTAPRARDAVARANAVANSYVSYVSKVLHGGSGGGVVQLLQPATGTLPASKLHNLTLAGRGLGVALVIGLVLALILASRDRRLRSRDEISRAIGVPVLASVEAKGCRTVGQWQRLLDGSEQSPGVSWSLRRVLYRLAPAGSDATQEIRVIAYTDDRPALATGAQLATVAASTGISTLLVPGDADVMVPLRAACVIENRSGRHPDLLALSTTSSTAGSESAELTICLLAVNRAKPEIQPFGGANVLTVSSGFATADDLARLALAAAEAAQAVDGIMVVNPEPGDTTAGSTAIEQRMITRMNRPPGAGQSARRSR